MSRPPGSWSHFWPCSRPPWPLPCPVIMAYPQPSRPMRPLATTRLMAAMQFCTPLEWCSIPRAWSRKLVEAGPQISAAFTIMLAGTPAIFAAYSGVYFFYHFHLLPSCGVLRDKFTVDPAALDQYV